MAGIIDELKLTYKNGSSLIRLIFINLGVFLFFQLVYLVLHFTSLAGSVNFINWFAVPSDFPSLILKPWTLITYMFYHEEIMHILFNLLWFYWFGKIFLYYFDQKKLVSLYILGGLAGALLFILSFNFVGVFQKYLGEPMLGASAAIMAIVFAVANYAPNFRVMLLFFGEVKLIYIAIVTIVLDLILLRVSNTGGHIAHIGGAVIGWLWCVQYRKGRDLTSGITWFLFSFSNIFKFRSRLKVSHKKPMTDLEYNRTKVANQHEIDRILDKISKGGYESLTKQEKETLFKMSEKK